MLLEKDNLSCQAKELTLSEATNRLIQVLEMSQCLVDDSDKLLSSILRVPEKPKIDGKLDRSFDGTVADKLYATADEIASRINQVGDKINRCQRIIE